MVSEPKALLSEDEILQAAVDELTKRLPSGWRAEVELEGVCGQRRVDAIVDLTSPDGAKATFYAEAKRALVTKDLSSIVAQLRSIIESTVTDQRSSVEPLVVARYLSPPLQTWLTEREVPYVDATGNMRIALGEPALFLRDVGAQKDPWRGPGRPKGNLTAGRRRMSSERSWTSARPTRSHS
jgi:hypothetical protein